jgi:hypothetical protein
MSNITFKQRRDGVDVKSSDLVRQEVGPGAARLVFRAEGGDLFEVTIPLDMLVHMASNVLWNDEWRAYEARQRAEELAPASPPSMSD